MAMAREPNHVPQLIRKLRQFTSLTQEQLAAKLGVTFPTVNRWENGRAKPSPLALRRIEELCENLGDKGRTLIKQYFAAISNKAILEISSRRSKRVD